MDASPICTASRASFQAMRKMRLLVGELCHARLHDQAGDPRSPFGTASAGAIDLTGVDPTNPAEVKEHLFGTVLRVDRSGRRSRTSSSSSWRISSRPIRSGTPPKVSGQQGLQKADASGR